MNDVGNQMENAYFLRWRDEISGPFRKGEILQKWETGSINGFYEIFYDSSWVLLSEIKLSV